MRYLALGWLLMGCAIFRPAKKEQPPPPKLPPVERSEIKVEFYGTRGQDSGLWFCGFDDDGVTFKCNPYETMIEYVCPPVECE